MVGDGIYFDEKRERKRRLILKLKIYGGLASFFVLAIGGYYLAVYSSVFQITRINVDNARINADSSEQIINDLKVYLANQSKIASFLGSGNILIWKKDVSQFKRDNLLIADITIEKDYFNREVKIEIKEREKFGILCGNACFWFDKSGVLFAEAPMVDGALINKVSDFTGRNLEIGSQVFEKKFMDNLLKIFAVLKETDLGTGFLELENLGLQEIIFNSPLGLKIYFSLRIDPAFSLAGIQSIKEVGLEKIDYVDFRVNNRVYYKLK